VSEARLRLRASEGTLWAVLDACASADVPARVERRGSEKGDCLFKGAARERYWEVAPWLANVDLGLFGWIRANLWDAPFGVFVEARATLDALRGHFRRIQVVEVPDGRRMYFRFYDPRVLGPYVASATAPERAELFGPVEAYWGVYGEPGARELTPFRREARP